MALHYRDEEVIYVQASPDRVTVIFSTMFREETDRVFGKVFLQVCLVFVYFPRSPNSDHLRRSLSTRAVFRPSRARPKCSTQRATRRWRSDTSPA